MGCSIIISAPTTHVGRLAAVPLSFHPTFRVKVGGYMKKKTLAISMMLLSVGALLLNSCGPEGSVSQDVALEEASKDWGLAGYGAGIYGGPGGLANYNNIPLGLAVSEYGHCNNGWDDNGNGWKDYEDPSCHLAPGPLRDLSLYDFPQGHNFFPDISKDIPGGPGYGGGFRDPAQMTRWFRFLTELDGSVAGIDLLSPGVNPEIVPFPEPLPFRVNQGTAAQGNNNNIFVPALHDIYLDHEFLPPPAGVNAPLLPVATAPGAPDMAAASTMHTFNYLNTTQTYPEWGPGYFYNGGSQGAIRPVRTGNPDSGSNE